MTNAKRKPFLTTRELATVAILAAISAVLFMIEIPVVLFYKLDLSHLPVLLGTFAMGPVPGTLILLVKSLLGLLHSSSQGVGELADFLMGFSVLLPQVGAIAAILLLLLAAYYAATYTLFRRAVG